MKTLDRCCTAFGKRYIPSKNDPFASLQSNVSDCRLLREWICRPSCRRDVIVERQEAVQELMNSSDAAQTARSILAGLPDLERLLSKIHAHGNLARMTNHPDGRAIMFEGPTYSKKKIVDFITTLSGFEDVLKLIALFEGKAVLNIFRAIFNQCQ